MNEDTLRHALADCFAPGSARNIIQSRIVRELSLREDREAPGAGIPGVPPRFAVRVHLDAPTLDDEARALLLAQIRNRLAGEPWISSTELIFAPPLLPILR